MFLLKPSQGDWTRKRMRKSIRLPTLWEFKASETTSSTSILLFNFFQKRTSKMLSFMELEIAIYFQWLNLETSWQLLATALSPGSRLNLCQLQEHLMIKIFLKQNFNLNSLWFWPRLPTLSKSSKISKKSLKSANLKLCMTISSHQAHRRNLPPDHLWNQMIKVVKLMRTKLMIKPVKRVADLCQVWILTSSMKVKTKLKKRNLSRSMSEKFTIKWSVFIT